MSSSIETRIRRPLGGPWPARPRKRRGSPAHEARLLTPAQWRRLASRLCRTPGESTRMRRATEAALWVLHTGSSWSSLGRSHPKPGACRRQWREWMRDGRWVDFWSAYITLLSPRERSRWARAFAQAGRGSGMARHAWWLVSARLLLDGKSLGRGRA